MQLKLIQALNQQGRTSPTTWKVASSGSFFAGDALLFGRPRTPLISLPFSATATLDFTLFSSTPVYYSSYPLRTGVE